MYREESNSGLAVGEVPGRPEAAVQGDRASLPRGRARVPAGAPLSGDRADDRRLPRLPEGPRRAAGLRRTGRGVEHAVADGPRREGEGRLGAEGVRSLIGAGGGWAMKRYDETYQAKIGVRRIVVDPIGSIRKNGCHCIMAVTTIPQRP